MSRVLACRVCLSSELNMYAIADTPLQAVYEKLTGSELQSADARPACVCYICLHQLRKCDSFIRRAVKADTLLTKLANSNLGVTKKSIEMIDKKLHNLEWMYQITDILTAEYVQKETSTEEFEQQTEGTVEIKNEYDEANLECVKSEIEYDEIKIEEHFPPLAGDWCHQSQDMEIKLDAEAEDEAAESADADNTSENSVWQNVAKYNEKTCENQRNKGPPFLILKRLNITLQKNVMQHNNSKEPDATCRDVRELGGDHNRHPVPEAGASLKPNTTSKGKSLNPQINGKPDRSVPEKNHKCTYCSYSCRVKSNLIRHIRTHTGEKPYKCEYCSYSCRVKSNLIKHIRTHTGEKPYKCEYCSYSCRVKSHLIEHIRTHTGEKPYKCEYCSYTCSTKSLLIIHNTSHTGQKPFKCEHCGYSSSKKSNFINHIRIHTGQKPFICEFCSYSSIYKSHLKTHIRTHTGEKPFKCEYCSYSCKAKYHLKTHIRVHTGEKPYKCEYCGYSCSQKSYLKNHIKIHTGAKSYKYSHTIFIL